MNYSAADIKAARRQLSRHDKALARADKVTPNFEWRVKEKGLPGLAQLIIEQQVSTASAMAIWTRFKAGVGEIQPTAILKFDPLALKEFGLSGPKARYIHALASALASGDFDFERLATMDDETAVAEMIKLKGVGLWTAEAYLMGCEGRTDLFPAGDMALQEGLRLADGSDKRLSIKELYARAELWKPHRGVAAHLLWSYYAAAKKVPANTDKVKRKVDA